MIEVGKLVGTRLVQMPREVLTDSVPGKVYHLTIETQGITDEKGIAKLLVFELREKFKARIVWIRVENGVIDMQLIGSPFAWAALIAFLPAIFSVLGIVMVLLSIYSVVAAIPGWAWALLATGVGVILLGPKITESVIGGYEKSIRMVRT